ncbi:hypothetical protein M8C13_06980 [Crossiella sp. SN42]|uniref:hypothetical protein n=1 Tax=Crossiella sp. SN42 TaxID=2944808 RepID=UPI00207D1597|nr:hypothetical protein [Crossiella sp. SN42]MCO1575500.1 hypothetical protein [Crossiella sp. SN42]
MAEDATPSRPEQLVVVVDGLHLESPTSISSWCEELAAYQRAVSAAQQRPTPETLFAAADAADRLSWRYRALSMDHRCMPTPASPAYRISTQLDARTVAYRRTARGQQ